MDLVVFPRVLHGGIAYDPDEMYATAATIPRRDRTSSPQHAEGEDMGVFSITGESARDYPAQAALQQHLVLIDDTG